MPVLSVLGRIPTPVQTALELLIAPPCTNINPPNVRRIVVNTTAMLTSQATTTPLAVDFNIPNLPVQIAPIHGTSSSTSREYANLPLIHILCLPQEAALVTVSPELITMEPPAVDPLPIPTHQLSALTA